MANSQPQIPIPIQEVGEPTVGGGERDGVNGFAKTGQEFEGKKRKRVVVVGLGMVGIAFM